MVKTEDGIESRLVNIDEDLLVIPSLAIHMQRNVNKGKEFNPQIDMQPLWGPAGCRTLTDVLCEELNVQPRGHPRPRPAAGHPSAAYLHWPGR